MTPMEKINHLIENLCDSLPQTVTDMDEARAALLTLDEHRAEIKAILDPLEGRTAETDLLEDR